MNKRYIDFVPVKKGETGAVKTSSPKQRTVIAGSSVKTTVSTMRTRVVAPKVNTSSTSRVTTASRVSSAPKAASSSKVSRVSGAPKASRVVTVSSNMPEMKKKVQAPNNRFIKNPKIAKRPLSNTGYKKEVKAQDEKPKGPVTIIEKPEKNSKLGLIVTIIITIVLGAAAGTVAFLLLPK